MDAQQRDLEMIKQSIHGVNWDGMPSAGSSLLSWINSRVENMIEVKVKKVEV
jgi:hypothetical protein